MTHEIICLSNPYLALSSCGDVRNVFLLPHHETLHKGVTVRPSSQKWYRMETSSCWSPDRPLCSKKNCTISHKTEAPQSLVSGFQNIHHHLQKYSKTPPGYGVVLEFLLIVLWLSLMLPPPMPACTRKHFIQLKIPTKVTFLTGLFLKRDLYSLERCKEKTCQ